MLMAPNPHEILWEHIAASFSSKNVKLVLYYLIIISLFVLYTYGQAILMNLLLKEMQNWKESWFENICPSTCQYDSENAPFKCSLCQSFVESLATMIVSFIICMVMAMLPFFIEWTVSLKCFASIS